MTRFLGLTNTYDTGKSGTYRIIVSVFFLSFYSLKSLQLKDEAVALVDTIAPPDFVLQSPIGSSDGQVCPVTVYFGAISIVYP